MGNRIKEIRKSKGLSQTDLAEACGTSLRNIQFLEKGERGIEPWMDAISKALGVPKWHLIADTADTVEPAPSKEGKSAFIHELDVTASAGNGSHDGAINEDTVVAEWALPSEYIRGRTDAPAPALKIIRVEGDSMAPDFPPGSRVMVNLSDRIPSPPGIFVVWDGMGLVMKRVEPIYGSDPARVRLSSINTAYSSYEATVEEAHINGRVIGKWQWT